MLDCKLYARSIKESVKLQLETIKKIYGGIPTLSIISSTTDMASRAYIKGKIRDCEEVGINVICTEFDADSLSEKTIIDKIVEHNNNRDITGIIVQLPLPLHINQDNIKNSIVNHKDIDGFKMTSGFEPCTPLGIIKLLDCYNIPISSKHCVIVGRSELVGRPLAKLLLDKDATVTICHSKTENLSKYTINADILISAVGVSGVITSDMVSNDTVLIDVGISRNANGEMSGDFTRECYNKTELYTIVPSGIGLVTRATLLENIIKAFEIQNNYRKVYR